LSIATASFDGLQFGRAWLDQPGAAFLPQAVAVAADGQDVAVVEKPVEDGGGDDGIAEDLAPFAD
jgi:hypothetical protein